MAFDLKTLQESIDNNTLEVEKLDNEQRAIVDELINRGAIKGPKMDELLEKRTEAAFNIARVRQIEEDPLRAQRLAEGDEGFFLLASQIHSSTFSGHSFSLVYFSETNSRPIFVNSNLSYCFKIISPQYIPTLIPVNIVPTWLRRAVAQIKASQYENLWVLTPLIASKIIISLTCNTGQIWQKWVTLFSASSKVNGSEIYFVTVVKNSDSTWLLITALSNTTRRSSTVKDFYCFSDSDKS